MTSDLCVRVLAPVPDDGEIPMAASILKSGRTMTVGDTHFYSTAGDLLGTAVGTFLAPPRPRDELPEGFDEKVWSVGLEQVAPTLAEQVGLQVRGSGRAVPHLSRHL